MNAPPARPHAMIPLVLLMLAPGLAASQDSPHGELTVTCDRCHTAAGWTELARPIRFNHSSTGFALEGQHVKVECRACHASLRFSDAPSECRDCHEDVHRGELGRECARCHGPDTWLITDMLQRHSGTRFPLLGAHIAAECQVCHPNQQVNQFVRTPTDCYSCHGQDYQATLAPAHAPSGIGTDCESCHSVSDLRWGGTFNHDVTAFPLTGAHEAVACSECHRSSVFRGLPGDCNSCHNDDFIATTSPAHAAGGFPVTCQECHSTAGWQPAAFDHNRTGFPLTGAHLAVQCAECHSSGQYTALPTQCSSCHLDDFNGTTAPAHAAGGFPLTCQDCHGTSAWQPASFDHNRTGFPLTGAHLAIPCTECHQNGQYAATPSQCSGCHLEDYNRTTAPAHAPAGFPLECQSCHGTIAWEPSTFNHEPLFPIASGTPHAPGRWTACTDCHTVSTNFRSFSCLTCHEHDQPRMDDKHREVSGYRYESPSCYECHPRGRGD